MRYFGLAVFGGDVYNGGGMMRVFQCASMACVILGSVGTAHGGAFADFIGKALPQVNWNPAQVNRNPVAYWLVQYESAQRELPEHAALCRAGRESMKDYPYIRKLVALYRDDPQLLPVEVLEDLVEMGAAVEADALYDAVHMPEACRVLAAAGADVNAGEVEQRDTPLHRAASMGCTETCRVLIAAGANPESTGYRNETALYSALNGYHRETARALLSPEAGSRGQLLAKGVRIGLPGAEGGGFECIAGGVCHHGGCGGVSRATGRRGCCRRFAYRLLQLACSRFGG